jgi:hypothetical protein
VSRRPWPGRAASPPPRPVNARGLRWARAVRRGATQSPS